MIAAGLVLEVDGGEPHAQLVAVAALQAGHGLTLGGGAAPEVFVLALTPEQVALG